ncbi:hypothetical protein [Spartinivicinus poritis]|uniref:Uncharacterized protein n=1 Tax=Spartinivicinus poritis TaxID=2994640 RepID=A0ABT5U7D2_9GAMM|nr:hypothetical protein [Spartinivicinus sp. A2-2]MDE1462279.1 hypothetical protein [Spartinivicinus sp. A2-2]
MNKYFYAYKKYASEPAYFPYRSDWNSGSTVYLFIKSLFKLSYFLLKEYYHYLNSAPMEMNKYSALVGTKNNQRSFSLLKSTITSIEPIGFHNYKANKQISFYKCYVTGLKSLGTAFYYCFVKRGKYRAMVAKTLNFFIIANGRFDIDVTAIPKKKYLFIFSEYSVYINKIVEAMKKQGFTIVYLPHSRMPKQHRPFFSDIVFLDSSDRGNAIYNGCNIYFIDKLNEILICGCETSGILRPPSVLICLNVLDSLKTSSSVIRFVSNIFTNKIVTVRFHPSEKFRTFKRFLLRIISRKKFSIDTSTLSESLSLGTLVIAGKSGVLVDALSRGLKVYSWISTEEICGYFSLQPESVLPLEALSINHLEELDNILLTDPFVDNSGLKKKLKSLAII